MSRPWEQSLGLILDLQKGKFLGDGEPTMCRRHYNQVNRKCTFPLHTKWWDKIGLKGIELRAPLKACPVRLIPVIYHLQGIPCGKICRKCLHRVDQDEMVTKLSSYKPPEQNQLNYNIKCFYFSTQLELFVPVISMKYRSIPILHRNDRPMPSPSQWP